MENKKSQTDWKTIFYIVGFLIVTWGVLFLLGKMSVAGISLFPNINGLSSTINYIIIVIVWVVLQASVVFCFYKLFTIGLKNFTKIKENIMRWSFNLRQYIVHKKH